MLLKILLNDSRIGCTRLDAQYITQFQQYSKKLILKLPICEKWLIKSNESIYAREPVLSVSCILKIQYFPPSVTVRTTKSLHTKSLRFAMFWESFENCHQKHY